MICCQARQRVERRVEVPLTGVIPGATSTPARRNSAKVNASSPANIQDEIQDTDGKNNYLVCRAI